MNLSNATFELGTTTRTSGTLLNRVTSTVPTDVKEADELLAGLRADAQEQTEANS